MPLIQVPKNVRPCQVEGFAPDADRSREGALYFMPGSTKVITEDEWVHIKEKHPALAARLVRVPYDERKGKIAKKKAKKPAPASAPPPMLTSFSADKSDKKAES